MLVRKSAQRVTLPAEAATRPPFPFIVGLPRSGTSLLTQMLHSHPDLALPPETHFFPKIVELCQDAADPARVFVEKVVASPSWPKFQIDADLFADRVGRLDPFDLGEALRTLYLLYAARHGKKRGGDKTPPNAYYMVLIQEVVPEAHFLHIIRDGRDVALSVKDLSFGPNTIEDAAAWWSMLLWRARGQVESLRNYFEVRYEDLVLDTETTLRDICVFLDLAWDPAMLRYYEKFEERLSEGRIGKSPEDELKDRTKNRKHFNELIGQPPRADRVGVWRREMALEDQRRFEEIAGEVLVDLDYEVGQE